MCSVCHRLENVGTEIGPNLATLQNRGAEAILLNVLDPNREVNPQYVNYILVTTEGRSITGLIAAETATSVTLKRQENATDTVLRANIEELRSTGQSIMPEGLEKQLDQQAVGRPDRVSAVGQIVAEGSDRVLTLVSAATYTRASGRASGRFPARNHFPRMHLRRTLWAGISQ